ncbi:MAG: PH domain-containing protein, partial [Halothece sp.]
METAGWIDTDIEINFKINNKDFSIDVKKQDLNQVQCLYKALVKISEIQEQNQQLYEDASHSLKTASEVIQSIDQVEINPE